MKQKTINIKNARILRKNNTYAEEKLWSVLRNRQFKGLKFRRQHPLGRYIADFYCFDFKVVIEVDGGIHNTPDQREYDAGRTHDLSEKGITVLRFTNDEVQYSLHTVLRKLDTLTSILSGERK